MSEYTTDILYICNAATPFQLFAEYIIKFYPVFKFFQDRGVKEDELQSILNYLLTMHEVHESLSLLQVKWFDMLLCHFAALSYKVAFHLI